MNLVIVGATGSIGRSALRVVSRHPDRLRVVALAARRDGDTLFEQAQACGAAVLALTDEAAATELRQRVAAASWEGGAPEVLSGSEAVRALAARDDVDCVLNAVVGAAGLRTTLVALRAGKRLALANKESLVAGGPLVLEALRAGGGSLVPVDSEHSAILQCLHGAPADAVERVILTASGGPFRDWQPDAIAAARPEDALRHPTWDMGAKITIDSATLANKALEVIEAHFLFGIPYERLEVVVHPQSIIHSMVAFRDGSVLAQVGFPTMELPILYALTHPARVEDMGTRFDPVAAGSLTFEALDVERFPTFGLGVAAGRAGGTAPAVFNAANEVAVEAFLTDRLPFCGVGDTIDAVLQAHAPRSLDSIETVLDADGWARRAALDHIDHRC